MTNLEPTHEKNFAKLGPSPAAGGGDALSTPASELKHHVAGVEILSAKFMAAIANLSGSPAIGRRVVSEYLTLQEMGVSTIDKQAVQLLLEESPTKVALSNSVLLMDLLDDKSEESTSGLMAIYERRLAEFQAAPQTMELSQ